MADFDSSAAVFRGKPGQLLKLINLGKELPEAWTQRDRSAILRHQLSAPVAFDLKCLVLDLTEEQLRDKAFSDAAALGVKTFSELFQNTQPPLTLLKLGKAFFKEKAGPSSDRLPQQEVAYLLYLLSLAVARLRLNSSITSLTVPELLRGLDWAISQDWTDDSTRALFSQARDNLAAAA
jgi:hypothetical protein